jgi:hypothetical protein
MPKINWTGEAPYPVLFETERWNQCDIHAQHLSRIGEMRESTIDLNNLKPVEIVWLRLEYLNEQSHPPWQQHNVFLPRFWSWEHWPCFLCLVQLYNASSQAHQMHWGYFSLWMIQHFVLEETILCHGKRHWCVAYDNVIIVHPCKPDLHLTIRENEDRLFIGWQKQGVERWGKFSDAFWPMKKDILGDSFKLGSTQNPIQIN